ncbi:hypothetical protein DL771_010030 [Monosporascus sp. 5C6A]|nr:hypothetical protein DL771_010030 [Monosporascus sp. 5C6A]
MSVFTDAENVSKRFKLRSAFNTAVSNPKNDLEADVESLHLRMKELALKRQKRSSFAQKAAWALYEKKHFDRLIEDVTSFVKDLVELFPALKAAQQELREAAEDVDELLYNSIEQTIAGKRKHLFIGNIAKDDVVARYGDEYEGNPVATGRGSLYKKNEASGKATVHYGDHYGPGSIFPPS